MQISKKTISVLGKTLPQSIRNNSDKVVSKLIPTAKKSIKLTNQTTQGKEKQVIQTSNHIKETTKNIKNMDSKGKSTMAEEKNSEIPEEGTISALNAHKEEEQNSQDSIQEKLLEELESSNELSKTESIGNDEEKDAKLKETELDKTDHNDGDQHQETNNPKTQMSEKLNSSEQSPQKGKKVDELIKEDQIEVEIQKKVKLESQGEQSNQMIHLTTEDVLKKVYGSCNSKMQARKTFPNVLFFANDFKSNFGQSYLIQDILKRRGNYNILELDHAYIQWIFPNKYQSMFNSKSQSLSDEEIDIFIRSEELSNRYIECYEMMLDFYGMRLIDKQTGQINRSVKASPNDYKTRYREAICGHNCLRIRRILTSLNNLGFRRYAIELVDFLEYEIKQGDRPLKGRLINFNKDWKQYGTCNSQAEIKQLEEVTFQTNEQLERKNIILVNYDNEEEKKNGTIKSKKERIEEKLLQNDKESTGGIKKMFGKIFGGK